MTKAPKVSDVADRGTTEIAETLPFDMRITAKRDGFRRGGIAHSAAPTLHHSADFTNEVLDQLLAEPMLIVEPLAS